jgi:hypothetical protein
MHRLSSFQMMRPHGRPKAQERSFNFPDNTKSKNSTAEATPVPCAGQTFGIHAKYQSGSEESLCAT